MYLLIFRIGHGNFTGLVKADLPLIGWFIDIVPVSNTIYTYFCFIGAFFSLMIVLGIRTRLFLILNAFTIFYVVATPNFFGKLWHEQIVIWISWVLALSPCYEILSFDSLKKNIKIEKHAKYNYHLKILWLQFGLIYFFAGFYKLWVSGFDWALSQSMVNQVQLEWFENYNKIPSIRIDHFPLLLKIGGISVIVFEMMYLFMLLNKKTKWLSIFGGLAMHNMIGHFMYISFFALLQVFYIVFIPWNFLLQKLKIISNKWDTNYSKINYRKITYLLPLLLLFTNFTYSVFRIDSYPFSTYPAYTNIVKDSYQVLEYKFPEKKYKTLKLWDEAKKTYFRWESFSRFEPEIIDKYRIENIVDTLAIKNQWNRWCNGVPILNSIDTIEVYGIEIYLKPEFQKDTIYREYLMTIYKRDDFHKFDKNKK